MRALDRKMLRDLGRIWAQTLAIALVLGCGVMVLVGAQATQATLVQTQAAYYERHRFPDIFSGATRVPADVVQAVSLIDGVAQAEGRISFQAVLDIDGMSEPATARILSLPAAGPGLNLPLVRLGRLPDPDRADEVALAEPFAKVHGLTPGSSFRGILNGQLLELTVTGWVLSPEFIYTMPPGAMMPDDRRYGLIWMNEPAAAAALDMNAAVNDIALRLTRDGDERAVIAALDQLLDPYGVTGAYGRDRQVSHAFLEGELSQLAAMAAFIPPIFLIVAAFLVNMVLGRLIALERPQIGLLKALGYARREIAGHYLKLAVLIGVIGVLIGWLFGWWISHAMIGLYGDFFRFPFIIRDWGAQALVISAVLGMATAVLGGFRAVWASLQLPPAEAMQPPAPPVFARGVADRLLRRMRFGQTTMMIFRSIIRWPGRALITLFGVSASVGVLVMSYFMFDAVERLADSVFQQANRQHVTLLLAQGQSERAVQDALALPGVLDAEGAYAMPVRAVNPARWRGHLAQILPARTRLSRGHHKAAPYAAIPGIMQELRTRKAVAALALEFTILTAARTGEVVGATWAEFDLVKAVWTIPASRMKASREHRVPLSDRSMTILEAVKELDSPWVFPGVRGGQMSGMAMAMLLRRMKSDVTVHGFRSSFRDWAAECTGYPHEVCEMALAHSIGNKVEAAYRRGDLFEKRRRLMVDWAEFCAGEGGSGGEVVPLRTGAL